MTAVCGYDSKAKQFARTVEDIPVHLLSRIWRLFDDMGDTCVTNGFAYESYDVEVEEGIYDIRGLLALVYLNKYITQFAVLRPCENEKWCVNPRHSQVGYYNIPTDAVFEPTFFGPEKNLEIMGAFAARYNPYDSSTKAACWENPDKNSSLMLVRRLFAATVSGWKNARTEGIKANADYEFYRGVKCRVDCVNPNHAQIANRSKKSEAVKSELKIARFNVKEQAAKRDERLAKRDKTLAEFKRFLAEDIVSSRNTFSCPTKKMGYSSKEIADKARKKWYELHLETLTGHAQRIYRCSCGNWHMTKQSQENR